MSNNSADINDIDPISEICLKHYPDQQNVIQATAKLQYWLNGPDPLDYINIYNYDDELDETQNHYHYVSLGLTDIYGDERVHRRAKSSDEPSGYGYELTIRVKKISNSKKPPKWPLKLMQALARYTFSKGALLDAGDHVPNVILENNSIIKHVLIAEDCQLTNAKTKFGKVKFLQIVGCTDDELVLAQKWSTRKVLDLMRQCQELGNGFLLTDLDRENSIFELYPELRTNAIPNIKKDGSNLSFVKSNNLWKPSSDLQVNELNPVFKSFKRLNFYVDLKSAKLMPTVLKQRLQKGHSFIFNGINDRSLILVPSNFTNESCHVSEEAPLKSNGIQCQILLNKQNISKLIDYFKYVDIKNKTDRDLPFGEKFYLNETNETQLLNLYESIFNLNILSKENIFTLLKNY